MGRSQSLENVDVYTVVAAASSAVVLVGGTAIILACGLAGAAAILEIDIRTAMRRRADSPLVERERDVAAALGIQWRRWLVLRTGTVAGAVALGLLTGIWAVTVLLAVLAIFGLRFALSGRAARQRLRVERAFIGQLRHLRDRMAVGNQSLDTALQEIGLNPGKDLVYILSPLARGGSILANIVECGVRSRSPIIEQACGVLIWARTRSLDALIAVIDDVLIPVGEAQLAVQEEAHVTLAQQRAVTFAMASLMGFMFAAVIRVDSFRAFYQTTEGLLVLLAASTVFFLLVAALGRIVSVPQWTRWNVPRMAELEVASHE